MPAEPKSPRYALAPSQLLEAFRTAICEPWISPLARLRLTLTAGYIDCVAQDAPPTSCEEIAASTYTMAAQHRSANKALHPPAHARPTLAATGFRARQPHTSDAQQICSAVDRVAQHPSPARRRSRRRRLRAGLDVPEIGVRGGDLLSARDPGSSHACCRANRWRRGAPLTQVSTSTVRAVP
ncbi:hypothetical protein PSPO01_12082 [Paraphaeosphaeria sporulosa]